MINPTSLPPRYFVPNTQRPPQAGYVYNSAQGRLPQRSKHPAWQNTLVKVGIGCFFAIGMLFCANKLSTKKGDIYHELLGDQMEEGFKDALGAIF